MAESLYGGVDGGASTSTFTLMRSDGNIVATSSGESTNQYLIGLEECLRRINQMVEDSLDKAGLPKDTTLESLGLSLSGGDETGVQAAIRETALSKYSKLARYIFVGSDTQSALATALPKGGVVLIAGTGSNCQLINEDGSTARCGGWGHMIGDEASACWITLKAVKTYFDHEDKMSLSPYPVETVKDVLFSYFKIKDCSNLIDHLYKDFDKTAFSGCCKHLAEAALEMKDPLCCWLFQEAGKMLAKHLSAIAGKMTADLKERLGGVPIVCVGSVFKSWDLLQPGFVQEMKAGFQETGIGEVTLLQLKKDASVGAAALGAKFSGQELTIDYTSTATAFFHAVFHP